MASDSDVPNSIPALSETHSQPAQWTEAVKKIQPVDDFRNLPQVPCARESLMYGIASAAGIGAIRFLNGGPRVAANWAVGTFVFISIASWEVCRRARDREQQTMRMIVEKYPQRNIRVAMQKAEEARAQASAGDAGNNPTGAS
ncbi:hypothetical protein BOTBODRAFT_36720, partial [Botryobasidium botryosum FD-172 SS1]